MTLDVAEGPEAPSGGGQPPAPGRHRRRTLLALVATACALVLALVLVLAGIGFGQGNSTDVVPGIDAPAARLLDLDVLSGGNRFTPPDFSLVDQHGKRVSLRQFRGKSVVLSFNDDQCPDLCTLLAQDVVVANHDLGPNAKNVVFLSVNVNPFYPEVRYVKAWTDNHGLGRQPNWVFTTGSVSELEGVWKKYGVYVQLNTQARTVVHGTELFFIDPTGSEQAIGEFGTNAANTSLYSHDMAQMASDLLPGPEQLPVGGPTTASPAQTDTAIGAHAPGFSLPLLGGTDHHVSLSGLRGRFVVLNFWASTCTACVQEMPDIERAFRDLGSKVSFVGIDVADTGSGAGFARRLGATYTLASDPSGSAAAAYGISGLPFTVIVGPDGTLRLRHPGGMTTEQLEYLVENFDHSAAG